MFLHNCFCFGVAAALKHKSELYRCVGWWVGVHSETSSVSAWIRECMNDKVHGLVCVPRLIETLCCHWEVYSNLEFTFRLLLQRCRAGL